MRVGYGDASWLVAVAFAEPGYASLVARMEGLVQLVSSNVLEAEVRAVLDRENVPADGALFGRLAWVLPDRPLTAEIKAVLQPGHLRGADLWHVACALYLSPIPGELAFLTEDQQQAAVAAAIGFATDAST